jgi:nitroreductase
VTDAGPVSEAGGPPFYDVVLRQRACRAFRPDPVDPEVLRRILTAATHAPSAENSQPWRFVVVTDASTRAAIAGLAKTVWERGAREHSKPHLSDRLLAEVDASTTGGGLAVAPVIVVVCGDTTATFPTALESSIWPCVQNLLLATAAEGLGAALTTMATLVPGKLAELLGLPAEIAPFAVIPLGHPAAPLGPPKRRPTDEVVHEGHWRA